VRGAAVPYHEPTSTDDDDVDDYEDDDVTSTSPASWPSTPSTPTSLSSTGRRAPPLELSARTLLWSSSPQPAYLAQSAGALDVSRRQSVAALAESGDVDALKAALKAHTSSVRDIDEVTQVMHTRLSRLYDRRNAQLTVHGVRNSSSNITALSSCTFDTPRID